MIPEPSSFRKRSVRMFVEIPSPDSWNSRNVRKPRIIRSRIISSDQRSPNASSETLTGHPDRRFNLTSPGTRRTLTTSLAHRKLFFESPYWAGTGVIWHRIPFEAPVIPAKEGIHFSSLCKSAEGKLDSRFRGNDCALGRPSLAIDTSTTGPASLTWRRLRW